MIRSIIEQDIDNIWTEIYKDPQVQGTTARDFFDFDFQFLPHKIFESDDFLKKCNDIRGRFSGESNESWFHGHESIRVPMDGLPLFIDKTWEKIRSQKELNLPDQRIMVAMLRCNELKEEALLKV